MNLKKLKRITSAVLAVCVILLSSNIVLADEADTIELIFTDVTATDTTTLKGETKIMVSVKGAVGTAEIIQTDLDFVSDDGVKYKSIQFLIGENNPPSCVQYSPNAVSANQSGNFMPGIISTTDDINLSGTTDLFILTFAGEAGKEVTLKSGDVSLTYVLADGKELTLGGAEEITAATSSEDIEGIDSKVTLTMDKVTDFKSAGVNRSGIELLISSETTDYSVRSVLSEEQRNNKLTVPTFVFENTLVDDTYTVELTGIGYVTYKKTGVTFDKALNITNADFIPGDINCDGKVDSQDKALYDEYITSGEYNDAADVNRDGVVDRYDNVYSHITGDASDGDNGGGNDNNGNNNNSNDNNGGTGGTGGGGGAGGGGNNNNTGGGGFGGGGSVSPSNPNEPFTDLTGYDWAKDAVYALKAKGIISGISETEYAPYSNIKRGDFMLILTRMLKIENDFTDNFADVPADMYYYDAIGRAKAAGIATGDGTNFMPENTITRQDLITLAYRAFLNAGYINEETDFSVLDQFGDKAQINDYATAPMASMVAAGIIKGSDGNVNPTGFATRAEVAVMCERLLNLM